MLVTVGLQDRVGVKGSSNGLHLGPFDYIEALRSICFLLTIGQCHFCIDKLPMAIGQMQALQDGGKEGTPVISMTYFPFGQCLFCQL